MLNPERISNVRHIVLKISSNLNDLRSSSGLGFECDASGNPGEAQKIADYYAISEEGLNNMAAAQFEDIRATGALAAVYAHMVSLMNWQRVIQRAMRRLGGPLPTN